MTVRKTASTITDLELDQLYDALDTLRAVARGYCEHCGRGDATPPPEAYEEQRARAARAEAAVARVRALHQRNEHSGNCEHCSERDYPDYAVRSPCPTIQAIDQPAPAAATRATHHQEQ